MIQQMSNHFAYIVTSTIYLIGFHLAEAQYLQSPCPDIFTYHVNPETYKTFGIIQISNIQVGQTVKLNVDLSIGTRLEKNNIGSIDLVKSREATFNDLVRGQPARYRINFPVPNHVPTVLSIAVNGQTICTGHPAQGRVVTTINLHHTLYTQAHSNGPQFQRPLEGNSVGYPTRLQHPSGDIIEIVIQPEEPNFWHSEERTVRPPYMPPRTTALQYVFRPPQTTEPFRTDIEPSTATPPASSSKYVCGKQSSKMVNRLSINGELVSKGQFPWIVPLFDRTLRNDPKFFCGSTIITRKHLVTAAHCVYRIDDFIRPESIVAVPGMHNIDNFLDENAKIVDIDRVIPHEEYIHDDDTNDADIAVLRLKRQLELSDYVIPVCPWQSENDLSGIVGQEAILAGWGLTATGASFVPTFIKSIIVDRQQCNLNLPRVYSANARIFCGDGRGSAPCRGDSGSGLVLKRGNQYYLRGVVSSGLLDPNTQMCDVTKYAIYTDIALFRFWLKHVTSE
ncbi:serine protease gd-like [Toxorhynchites rutilus septentrionalis]|uniref:serine protease gd-like n=1 Tax=Toxorhynchites rutilus septentrionalis TaxID=329112 RepID=UPI0024794E84|nr:serine protease gd-like [Toxorhynchites rutilus septentrionalis]